MPVDAIHNFWGPKMSTIEWVSAIEKFPLYIDIAQSLPIACFNEVRAATERIAESAAPFQGYQCMTFALYGGLQGYRHRISSNSGLVHLLACTGGFQLCTGGFQFCKAEGERVKFTFP